MELSIKQNYKDFISILQNNVEFSKNKLFTLSIEFTLNSLRIGAISNNQIQILQTYNTQLIINPSSKTISIVYAREPILNLKYDTINTQFFNLTISYELKTNKLNIIINQQFNATVYQYIDLFLSDKIQFLNQLNVDLWLNKLVLNNQQVSLYNGYTSEYNVAINRNIGSIESNYMTTTRQPATTRTTRPTLVDLPSKSTSFLYPWGVVIMVCVGSLIIITSFVVIIALVYRRRIRQKKLSTQNLISGSKANSTFNSKNGLFFKTSQLSTASSGSSILSGYNTAKNSSHNDDGDANLEVTNQASSSRSNENLIKNCSIIEQQIVDSTTHHQYGLMMNSSIMQHIGPARNSDKSSYGCCTCSDISCQNNNNTGAVQTTFNTNQCIKKSERINFHTLFARNLNHQQSLSSTSSSMSANDDVLNTTTTTESLRTSGSVNEINLGSLLNTNTNTRSNYETDTAAGVANFSTNLNFSNDFNEQFKQILNWTPSFDLFKDVFDDLSNLSVDYFSLAQAAEIEINDLNNMNNYYHETEFEQQREQPRQQQQQLSPQYQQDTLMASDLPENPFDSIIYNELYEKDSISQNTCIEVPIHFVFESGNTTNNNNNQSFV